MWWSPIYQLQLSEEAFKIDLHVLAEINYALMTTSYPTLGDRPAGNRWRGWSIRWGEGGVVICGPCIWGFPLIAFAYAYLDLVLTYPQYHRISVHCSTFHRPPRPSETHAHITGMAVSNLSWLILSLIRGSVTNNKWFWMDCMYWHILLVSLLITIDYKNSQSIFCRGLAPVSFSSSFNDWLFFLLYFSVRRCIPFSYSFWTHKSSFLIS
jgi:hypothetical protein